MKHFSVVAISILVFTSVTRAAEMIETHTKPSKGGTVSYRELPIGNDGRRADAIAEIENFCDEDYEIVSESKSKELGGIAAVGRNLLAPVNRKYVNLTFDCKETKAP